MSKRPNYEPNKPWNSIVEMSMPPGRQTRDHINTIQIITTTTIIDEMADDGRIVLPPSRLYRFPFQTSESNHQENQSPKVLVAVHRCWINLEGPIATAVTTTCQLMAQEMPHQGILVQDRIVHPTGRLLPLLIDGNNESETIIVGAIIVILTDVAAVLEKIDMMIADDTMTGDDTTIGGHHHHRDDTKIGDIRIVVTTDVIGDTRTIYARWTSWSSV
jgi:hypothetical protein